ncbi:hypothetical protein OH76DRAFT_1365156, partial [Lentinus brumalis]
LSGELRFRLTASRNPASFPFGLDLMTKRGVPWSVPLPVVAGNRSFAPIRHILTTVDATVPQQVMDIARNHHQKSHSGDVAGTRHLYAFFQPFDLALDRNYVAFAFVGKESIAYTTLQHIASFQTRRNGEAPQLYTPFSGTVLCCFEPSSLPEHSGKRVALIRVLRALAWDPIRPNPSYNGPPVPPELCPQEGQLLMTRRFWKSQAWARDVDKHSSKLENRAKALGTLFDNAREYGSST